MSENTINTSTKSDTMRPSEKKKLPQNLYLESEENYCIGCETGADCHEAHLDEKGNRHPACVSWCSSCK